MKKTIIAIAILLGITTCAMAQEDYNGNRGLFGRGGEPGLFDDLWSFGLFESLEDEYRDGLELSLPGTHGESGDSNGTPLGSGVAVLLGLGGAYLVAKKRKE